MNTPNKLPLTSENPIEKRIDSLKNIFPEVFPDGKFNIKALTELISPENTDVKERFGLSWPGKNDCMKIIRQSSVGTLLPVRDESVEFDLSNNVMIEGDNLEVLKLLQKSYYNGVKLIFIDPPYNTGTDFIYPDNFTEGLQDYLRYSGQVDAKGLKLSANTEADGRFHSKWLNMMFPRLFLARNLLKDDGFIFVTIDDHEVHNLRALMNEVFGEENFIANVVWQKKYTRANDARWFSDNHDHVLVFARNKELATLNLLPRSEEQTAAYTNPDNHLKGKWKATPLHAKSGTSRESYMFNNGVSWEPPVGTFRRYSNATMKQMDDGKEIWFGDDLLATPSRKSFLTEVKAGVTPVTIWPYDEVGHNHEANSELKSLLGEGVFDNPKPTRLIRRILGLATNASTNDVVLDFFAGSGTTGDAVIRMNAEDGGNRSFVLIQLPEPTDSSKYPTIASITRERIRQSIKLHKQHNTSLGFKALRLSTSNFQVWNGDSDEMANIGDTLELFASHVAQDRGAEDILYELLLKAGFPLTAPIEKLNLADKEVFSVSEGALLICLDRSLTLDVIESMVNASPSMILCLDEGFKGNDQLKVNAVQTVKSRNQNDETDIVFRVV